MKRRYHLDVCTPSPDCEFVFSVDSDKLIYVKDIYDCLGEDVKVFLFVDGVLVNLEQYFKECDF